MSFVLLSSAGKELVLQRASSASMSATPEDSMEGSLESIGEGPGLHNQGITVMTQDGRERTCTLKVKSLVIQGRT
jgi:hypothetical protein